MGKKDFNRTQSLKKFILVVRENHKNEFRMFKSALKDNLWFMHQTGIGTCLRTYDPWHKISSVCGHGELSLHGLSIQETEIAQKEWGEDTWR